MRIGYKEILYKVRNCYHMMSVLQRSHNKQTSVTSVLASGWSDNLLLLGRLHLDVKLGDLTQIPSARKLNMLLSGLSFQSLSETF